MSKGLEEFYQCDLLTIEECDAITTRVGELEEYWVNRNSFYTLGASTYLDDPHAYPAIANVFNQMIEANFKGTLTRLATAISNHKKSPVVFKKGTGLPSFHIFDNQANGLVGSLHIDEPYERIDWGQKVTDPFSFTVLVEEPEDGAGLEYWPNTTDADIAAYEVDHTLPEPEYLDYTLGKLYIHNGLVPHRIANTGDLNEGEFRVTLQGHGVTLANGDIVIYF